MKQGRNDEIRTYSESFIVGICHVPRTGFSPYTVRKICIEVAFSSTNTNVFPVANMFAQKLKANNEQCIELRVRPAFANSILFGKKGFCFLFVLFANSV